MSPDHLTLTEQNRYRLCHINMLKKYIDRDSDSSVISSVSIVNSIPHEQKQTDTTTVLSKLLTSCLTTIKSHVIRYCETVYETSNKNWFWSMKNSGEVLSKLKCRGLRATSLSTYDFSTLYTTLPHNLIKEKKNWI